MVAPGITHALDVFHSAGLPVTGAESMLNHQALNQVNGFDAVMTLADSLTMKSYRQALADRTGFLIPLINEINAHDRLVRERHLCINTTAAGGNASLVASSS